MFICWVSLSDKGSYFLGASLSFDFFGAPCTNRKPSSGTTWFSCWWKSLISLFWMWKTEGSSPAPVFYFVLKGLPHFQTPKFQSTGSLPQITDLGNACYYSMCTFSFKLAHVNWFATMKGEGLMFCTAASLNWHILYSWLWNLDGPLVAGSSADLQPPSVSAWAADQIGGSHLHARIFFEKPSGGISRCALFVWTSRRSLQSPWPTFLATAPLYFSHFVALLMTRRAVKSVETGETRSVALNWFSHHTKSWGKQQQKVEKGK